VTLRRVGPAAALCACLCIGFVAVYAPRHPAAAHLVAYRGVHRVGDMIGPNARVAAVDAGGAPTAIVSTNGQPPVVWAFELTDPSRLAALPGRPVSRFATDPWNHPACPSPLCGGGPHPSVPSPPPPLPLDICPALGPGEDAFAPEPGVCLWSGVEVEAGDARWWSYLAGLGGLYRAVPSTSDELVNTRAGVHVAVRAGGVTVVVLSYSGRSVTSLARIAERVATWVAAH
jgi:hypothetical protein